MLHLNRSSDLCNLIYLFHVEWILDIRRSHKMYRQHHNGKVWWQTSLERNKKKIKTHRNPTQAVGCHYNAVNFLLNHHKRHPIARPLWRGMGCRLCIQIPIYILPQSLQWCTQYPVIFDRVITAPDCIWVNIVNALAEMAATYREFAVSLFWHSACFHVTLIGDRIDIYGSWKSSLQV